MVINRFAPRHEQSTKPRVAPLVFELRPLVGVSSINEFGNETRRDFDALATPKISFVVDGVQSLQPHHIKERCKRVATPTFDVLQSVSTWLYVVLKQRYVLIANDIAHDSPKVAAMAIAFRVVYENPCGRELEQRRLIGRRCPVKDFRRVRE
jgi:hypothetical protein